MRRLIVAAVSRSMLSIIALQQVSIDIARKVPLTPHLGLDALGRRARHAGGADDSCFALHDTIKGRRHCVDALLRYNNGAVPVGVDEIAAPHFHAVNGHGYAELDHMDIGV